MVNDVVITLLWLLKGLCRGSIDSGSVEALQRQNRGTKGASQVTNRTENFARALRAMCLVNQRLLI